MFASSEFFTVYHSQLSCADDRAMLNIYVLIKEIRLNLSAHNLVVCLKNYELFT
jgi:hypothetical protein